MKFISGNRGYTTFIKINGASQMISFEDKGHPYNYGYFLTNNKEVIDALKRHPEYGTVFREERKEVEETAPVKEYAKVYDNVHKTQEAKQVLVSEHNVEPEKIKSKADVLRVAEDLNINFPNL